MSCSPSASFRELRVTNNPQYPPPYPPPPAGWGIPAVPKYSNWSDRLNAYMIDALVIQLLPALLYLVAALTGNSVTGPTGTTSTPTTIGKVLMGIALALALTLWVWNRGIRQGKTGQSIGKKIIGIHLINATTGAPVGVGTALLRDLCHLTDWIFGIGFLRPLWDSQRQTFSDKIVGTYVKPHRP